MKHSDYVRLAKISLKERKKSTHNTVRGISFGLILLLPLLFITSAFYIDLNRTVNINPSIRNFNVGIINEKNDDSNAENLYVDYLDNVKKVDGIKSIIPYQSYVINNTYEDSDINRNTSCMYFTVDGTNYEVETTSIYNEFKNVGIDIFDTKNPLLTYEANYLLAGSTFSDNAKNEIMVSTAFLNKYQLEKDYLINKSISVGTILSNKNHITTSKSEIIDNLITEEGEKVPLFSDYKIVGVFDSKIYQDETRENNSNTFRNSDVFFWMNSSSIISSDNETFLPEKKLFERKGINNFIFKSAYFYYDEEPTVLANKAMEKKMAFLPIGFGVDTNSSIDSKVIFEFDNYKHALTAAGVIEEYLKSSTTYSDPTVFTSYMSETFANYRLFYKIFTYVCIIFAIFGGVVFFANLLNLYNTINYSVQSRTNYIGLTRAIGMKSKDVIRLYFVEILEIFKRSYLWTALIGGALSLIIKFVFDIFMSSDYSSSVTLKLSLNPLYILLSFIVIVIINTIISIIFALITAYSVANKPILDTLIDDK